MAISAHHDYVTAFPELSIACQPATVEVPQWLAFNQVLAESLGLPDEWHSTPAGLQLYSGQVLPPWAKPHALAYAGHQFGNFVPQLGDGRAILLSEVVATNGQRYDIQLKGAGRTPYSRGGDGRSALGPVLREYSVSEAMHRLGIPTTRALAAVATGELVQRETALPGAILTRIAASHLRVGTAQFVLGLKNYDLLKRFADYVIQRHYPAAANADNQYLALLNQVMTKQAQLIAKWMSIGFIHGVMNTDNMTLSGETIDYGPCAFMEAYNPQQKFSSIDRTGRYAYQNQGPIGLWNIARYAETLLPLINTDADLAVTQATEVIEGYEALYEAHYWQLMAQKIGVTEMAQAKPLLQRSLNIMESQAVDFTLAFRLLGDPDNLRAKQLFDNSDAWQLWYQDWQNISDGSALNQVNPAYIPRNHLVQQAIDAAVNEGDLEPFNRLNRMLAAPFTELDEFQAWLQPARPEQQVTKTFCGT